MVRALELREDSLMAVLVWIAVLLALPFACGTEISDEYEATEAAPARLSLGLRDHGRTVVVTTRTNLSLTLGGPYRWSRPASTGVAVAAHETVSDAPTGATTWELRPAGTGRAVLRSRGSPACSPATPRCPQRARTYTVTLLVR